MLDIDVLNDQAFNVPSLTTTLEDVPYEPSFLDSLGLFSDVPLYDDIVRVEKRGTTLSLVPTSPRGAPVPQKVLSPRTMRAFQTVRIANGDRVKASELFRVRAFGSATELQTLGAELIRRLDILRRDNNITHEYHRLGAIQGLLLDSDGTTVIEDYFADFGVSQATEIDFNLDANPGTGAIYSTLTTIKRTMQDALGGLWTPGARVIGLAGNGFFDALTTADEVRKTYLNQIAARELQVGLAEPYSYFDYNNVRIYNYHGMPSGPLSIPTDKCKFIPVGVPGVFQRALSPGERMQDLGTLGRPQFAMQVPDRDRDMWVDLEIYSYPLYLCTRPDLLLRGRTT